MKILKSTSIAIFLILITACNRSSSEQWVVPDDQNQQITVSIHRYGEKLFSLDTSNLLQELKSIKWHPKTALIISPECLASHDMLDSIKNMLNGKTAFDCTLKAFPELGEKIKAFEARKPKLSRDQLHMLKDIMCSKSIMEYVKKTGKARATLYRHLDQMVFQENVHNLEELKMKAINQGWLN